MVCWVSYWSTLWCVVAAPHCSWVWPAWEASQAWTVVPLQAPLAEHRWPGQHMSPNMGLLEGTRMRKDIHSKLKSHNVYQLSWKEIQSFSVNYFISFNPPFLAIIQGCCFFELFQCQRQIGLSELLLSCCLYMYTLILSHFLHQCHPYNTFLVSSFSQKKADILSHRSSTHSTRENSSAFSKGLAPARPVPSDKHNIVHIPQHIGN